MSPKSQALTLMVLLVGVASAQKPFLECPSKNRDVMVSFSHLSEGLSDLKQNGTQEEGLFSDTVLYAFHIVLSVLMEVQASKTIDWNILIGC